MSALEQELQQELKKLRQEEERLHALGETFEEEMGDLEEAKLSVADTRDDWDKRKGELAQVQVCASCLPAEPICHCC